MDYCLFPGDPSSRIRKEFNDIQQDKFEYFSITLPDPKNAILSLMAFPMAENAVNPQIALMMENSREKFEARAREWTDRYAWIAEVRPEQSPPSDPANSDKGKKSKAGKENESDKKSKGSKSSKKGKK
ncbi:unnamed protein product [Taenia asiatica]|uniref:UBC core domain-containing protein n=1 Tax=Taenia asiatica TaxID=60517 RepID=A0A0R3VSM4_TAEAS|nr:unnamed protein product [Taenia asiatica]